MGREALFRRRRPLSPGINQAHKFTGPALPRLAAVGTTFLQSITSRDTGSPASPPPEQEDDASLRETRQSMSRAVKAATRDKVVELEEKHIFRVCKFARENIDNFEGLSDMLELLDDKMHSTGFKVALKAHMLFHIVVLDYQNISTDDKYQMWNHYLSMYASGVPPLSRSTMPPLVVHYNRYLSQRMTDFATSSRDPIQERLHRLSASTRDSVLTLMSSVGTDFKSNSEVVDLTQTALAQAKLIMECNFTPDDLNQPLYLKLYNMMAVDLSIIFRFLNIAIVFSLQSFFSLTRTDAQRTLFIYKEFMQLRLSDDILHYVSIATNAVDPRDLNIPPALQQDDASILQLTRALESYLYAEQSPDCTPTRHSAPPAPVPTASAPPRPRPRPPSQAPIQPPNHLPPSPAPSVSMSMSDITSAANTIAGPSRHSEPPIVNLSDETMTKADDFRAWMDSVIGTDAPHFDLDVQQKMSNLTTFYDQLDNDILQATAGPTTAVPSVRSQDSHSRLRFSKSITNLLGGFKKQ